MSVLQIINFIIIFGLVFLHPHSADDNMPQMDTCVQIPCAFNISNFEEKCNKSELINGIWLKKYGFIVFNSSEDMIRGFSDKKMTGNLSERNCTPVFYNITKNHSDVYYFRLEMEPNVFRAMFNISTDSANSSKTFRIAVIDLPQPLKPKPYNLSYMMEGSPVTLRCSAEAPCPKQPPTISWSNIPESATITSTTQLHEKPDKTQSVISLMSFKASYRDHGKNISCTATYPTNTPKDTTVETTIMLQVLFPPKETQITIHPSASVSVGTNVTLTCKSKASPSNQLNYTLYKRGQKMPIAYKKKITFNVTQNDTGWYSCTAQNKHGNQSSKEIQLKVEVRSISNCKGQDGHSILMIAGCVGGIVAVLTLSALGFGIGTRKKTQRGSNDEEKDSLNQAQDEPMDRNSTYANILPLTKQDKKISDDQSVCDRNTDILTRNEERGSDVMYAQVHILHRET